MTFTFGWALAILVVMYYVSSVLSTKTRARIGTMIFFSVFILIGYWTIFPADIIATSQIPVVAAITNLVLLINVGSSFDLATLKQDWRVVVVTLVGCLGMGVLVFATVTPVFGLDMAISSYPCLVGGLVATNLVNETLMNKGLEDLAVTIVLMLSMQTFVGMPVMSFGARKECERLLADYRTGKIIAADPKQDAIAKSTPTTSKALIDRIPAKYNTPILHLASCLFLGALASSIAKYTSSITNGLIGTAIVGIVIGILFKQLGLLAKEPLAKAGVLSFFMMAMMIMSIPMAVYRLPMLTSGGKMYWAISYIRVSFAKITPMGLVERLWPVAFCIIIGAIGVLLFAIPMGKKLGISSGLIMAITMGSYAGYPLNYQVCMEVITLLAQSPEEEEYLKDHVLQKVIIGGVVSVSLASVIIAGVMVSML